MVKTLLIKVILGAFTVMTWTYELINLNNLIVNFVTSFVYMYVKVIIIIILYLKLVAMYF